MFDRKIPIINLTKGELLMKQLSLLGRTSSRTRKVLAVGVSIMFVGTAAFSASAGAAGNEVTYSGGKKIVIAQRIADKIAAKQALNFVISYPYITIAGASAQMEAGAKIAAAAAKKKYGVDINIKVVGTPSPDAPTQIGQITAGLNADQYDCIGATPNPPGAFTNVFQSAIDKGVPVFTINADSPDSARIGTYMADDDGDMKSPLQMGRIAGNYAIKWAQANKQTFAGKKVALITGDSAAPWAQGRMQGFVDTIKAKYPTVKFIGTPTNGYMVGFDPPTVLSKLQSFMTGHKDTFFYFSSDWGGVQIGQLIDRNKMHGKVFGLGYNLNAALVKLIKSESVIGTIDQRYDLQAGNWVTGCMATLVDHKAPGAGNWVTPNIWNKANIADAIKLYNSIPNSGVL